MQNMNFFKILVFMLGFRLTFTVCFSEIPLSEIALLYTPPCLTFKSLHYSHTRYSFLS